MNPQIMQLKIKLAESQKEFKEISLKVTRLFNELSSYICPWFGNDVESIEAEKIEQIGDEMIKYKNRLCELKKLIAELEKELG